MRLFGSPLVDKKSRHEFKGLETDNGLYSPLSTQKRFFNPMSPILNGYHINFFNFSKAKKHFYTELNRNKSKSKIVYPPKTQPIKVKDTKRMLAHDYHLLSQKASKKKQLSCHVKSTCISKRNTLTIMNNKCFSSYQQQSSKKRKISIQIHSAMNEKSKTITNPIKKRNKTKKSFEIMVDQDHIISANQIPKSIRTQMLMTNPYITQSINKTHDDYNLLNKNDNRSQITNQISSTEFNVERFNSNSNQLNSIEQKFHKKTCSENMSLNPTKSQSVSSTHSRLNSLSTKNRYHDLLNEYFSDEEDTFAQFRAKQGIIKIKVDKVRAKC